MKIFINRYTLIISMILLGFVVYAQGVKIDSTVNYKEVKLLIDQKVEQYGVEDVLIVFDIDNTILTSNVDLGGDVWYQWQTGKLNIKPTEKQKVKKCFYEDAIGLLYELGTTNLTDKRLPGYISGWQQEGVSIMALTSRSSKYRFPTERELIKHGVDFSISPLKTIEGNEIILNYKLKRSLSYMNGIMMTTGMNKGKMLELILGRTGRSFKSIIFIDDSEHNIENMAKEFNNNLDIDMNIVHYQKIINERKIANGGEVLTQAQVDKMAEDWDKLQKTLNEIFPGRDTGDCVSPY